MSTIAAGLSALDRLDRLARLDTAVHRVDPRAKVITTAVFVVCVVSTGKYDLLGLLPFAVFPVVLAAEGDLPLGFLGRLLLMASPFALVMAAFNPLFDREVVAWLGSVPVTGGWISFASIVLRFLLTVAAALVLTATTSFAGVCLALEKLRVPEPLVTQLLLLYRYVFVLGDETRRMAQARRLRSFGRRGRDWRVYGQMLGHLLLRTFARAQRIYLAMKARGFDGSVRVARPLHFGPGDLVFTLGWSALFALFRTVNVPLALGRLVAGVLGIAAGTG
ncbi:MAG: cobalt ECF transporter T component CbiQ [Actinobacteria bacterium]|nr:cobalt ECF transporter T component CbiQ [Actinomycetota bacterium]